MKELRVICRNHTRANNRIIQTAWRYGNNDVGTLLNFSLTTACPLHRILFCFTLFILISLFLPMLHVQWSVCLYVPLRVLGTLVSFAKTDEPIQMPTRGADSFGSKVPWIRCWCTHTLAAMRLCVKLLWPLVHCYSDFCPSLFEYYCFVIGKSLIRNVVSASCGHCMFSSFWLPVRTTTSSYYK